MIELPVRTNRLAKGRSGRALVHSEIDRFMHIKAGVFAMSLGDIRNQSLTRRRVCRRHQEGGFLPVSSKLFQLLHRVDLTHG